jgi:flavodoxin
MHTHTLATNRQEMSMSRPGDTNEAHRPSTGRQERIAVGRRPFLQTVIGGIAGMMVGIQRYGEADAASPRGEADPNQGAPGHTQTGSTVLLAYFSRAGENYYYGDRIDLEVGNTEVLAGMISEQITCDVYRIEPVDPYPWDYEETRARNVQEQDADARPAIANPRTSIEGYDVVLLGSPIWNVRAPMIMSTFTEAFDFTGTTVFPVVTYAISGLGTTERDYAASCPGATIGEGLAVRGEEVQDAGAAVESWLRRIDLLAPGAPQ